MSESPILRRKKSDGELVAVQQFAPPMHLYNISVDGPEDSTEDIMEALERAGFENVHVTDEGIREFDGG